MDLTVAQRLKFRLLAEGMAVTPAARQRLDDFRGERDLTPADYASTTGLILRLPDDVWVNAPIRDHNQNFVRTPASRLIVTGSGFMVVAGGEEVPASVWLPPRYHGTSLSSGRSANHFVFSHGDRVRLSPIRGCAMRCEFCNIPYEDPYDLKPVDSMLEGLRVALSDPQQPARHILISGGTPAPKDVPFLRDVYERVLGEFGSLVDIMMVPVADLFDLPRLKSLGLNELSVNIEVFDEEVARKLMPQKHSQGLSFYLDFIAAAAEELGPGKVRSMVMVGLESAESTLDGVRSVLQSGGVPVLSPFRPDPATPLSSWSTMSAEDYERIFLSATELAAAAGSKLGPTCPPCTHNTLTLVPLGGDGGRYVHPVPELVP